MTDVRKWSRLDNAAKIFPPTSSKRDPKVFRFVCELNEPVDEKALPSALKKTLKRFPFYKSVLKKGLFWYFFEESTLEPVVKEENSYPCAPIYNPDEPGLLFRICYYKNRINLEVFHALTDGMGAVHFLRTLVYYYLIDKHPDCMPEKFQLNASEPPLDQIGQDAFQKYYDSDKKVKLQKQSRAYQIKGAHLPDYHAGIVEGILSAKSILEAAHSCDATLSEFLVTLLICSIGDSMAVRDRKHPVVITVPVNLRHFFPTQTARNFFGIIHIGHNFKEGGSDFAKVLENVRNSFKEQLVPEKMLGIIDFYASLENNAFIKAMPLALKIPCLKLGGQWANRQDTAAISNLGVISMPPELSGYIRLFDIMICTRRPQICLCSFQDNLSISYSSQFQSTGIPCSFFRKLTDMGIAVEINSNLEQEEVGGDAVLQKLQNKPAWKL